jgi:hypothetical protein
VKVVGVSLAVMYQYFLNGFASPRFEKNNRTPERYMQKIPSDAYVMIIGAMKCGTSSLFTYLTQHPEICGCVTKEPEFFSQHQDHRREGVTDYEDLWSFNPERHRWALEASTGYTKFPEEVNVPKRIIDYGLQPKFIYLVRNPFERIRSHHEQLARLFPDFDRSLPLTSNPFVNTSNYFLQLAQYRRYFPKQSFLVLDFDELKSYPQQCVLKVCSFLGLANRNISDAYPAHHQTLSRPRNFVARNAALRRAAKLTPRPVRQLSRRILERLFKTAEWTNADRDIVLKRLAADMYRFQAEYGIDVGRWGWTQDRKDLLLGPAADAKLSHSAA